MTSSAWVGLIVIAAIALAVVIVLTALTVSNSAWSKLIGWTALAVVVLGILTLTLTSGSSGSGVPNLTPGATIFPQLTNPYYPLGRLNVIGNVAMFVPFGWLLAARVPGGRIVIATVAGISLSIAIEVIQSLTHRVGDIDDVILNGLGAFVGAVMAVVVRGVARVDRRARR